LSLTLSYKRWLRGPEKKTLIPVFGDIVESRQVLPFSLSLSCTEGGFWEVEGTAGRFCGNKHDSTLSIGISNPHGITHVSPFPPNSNLYSFPFKEAEYLSVRIQQLSIDTLSPLHHLVELRTPIYCHLVEPTVLPVNVCFYHVIRVLEAEAIHPSYLTGQTFPELERCRVGLYTISPNLTEGLFTEMPVCTRLDVKKIRLLTAFKLPLVCELAVAFDDPESNLIWEKDITVNANLSGLRCLYVLYMDCEVELIKILGSVPVLESLDIKYGGYLNVNVFRALVPNQTSGLRESCGVTQIPTVLCPMLESVQVTGLFPTWKPELMHVLEEVVTLHAAVGSPLKTFTFFASRSQFWGGRLCRYEFEVIGGDGSFAIKVKEMYGVEIPELDI
jgi:hypothetical protein